MLTNSTITKLSSSVVTTSSTPKRVLRNVGPSSSSAPASMAAAMIIGIRSGAGSGSAPVPSTIAMIAPA